jgi:hypothetical protein
MEAVRTSETSVDNYFILQYIPEDNSEHHTRRRENLKSHKAQFRFKAFLIMFCWQKMTSALRESVHSEYVSHDNARR